MPTSGTPSNPRTVTDVLKQYWGFDALRPLQQDAIDASLAGRDSLVVLPTGGGKSLCYQIPPAVLGRLDVVVSPLISLMKDQVDGLVANGYPAAAIHSNLTEEERASIRRRLEAKDIRLLFTSPERLVAPGFLDFLARLDVRAFAIDEAHCISHWGHDFRPEYRRLASLRRRFPHCSVHAFTATATPRVREDIVHQLHLREPAVLVGRFDRPNLTYRIVQRVDSSRQVLEIVRRHAGEAVIVYCISRKETENFAAFLEQAGVKAGHYHAGMDAVRRRRVQEQFSREKLDVVVATVAFGMGIDRSNVRAVIHAAMPKTIEAYQQETGRAGRDGLEAECVMLYSGADPTRWRRLMEDSAAEAIQESPGEEEAIRAAFHAQLELLQHMRGFAAGAGCRHRRLSEYFGQAYEEPSCGACDVCLGELAGVADSQTIARKILSCVARVDGRFGAGHVGDILAGANTEMIRSWRHDQLSTYGLLKGEGKKAIANYIHQLVDLGALVAAPPDRPLLRLTDFGREVMHNRQEVGFVKSVAEQAVAADPWEGVDRELFELLRGWRREVAEERGLPPFIIFHDSTLRELARRRPTTRAGLEAVPGMSRRKAEEWGEHLQRIIQRYCSERGVDPDVAVVPAMAPRATPSKSATKSTAFKLFAEGASIELVVAQTGRAASTIRGYLVEYIEQHKPASIAPWVGEDVRRRVIEAARELEAPRLRPIYDLLGGEVSFDLIAISLAHAVATDA